MTRAEIAKSMDYELLMRNPKEDLAIMLVEERLRHSREMLRWIDLKEQVITRLHDTVSKLTGD